MRLLVRLLPMVVVLAASTAPARAGGHGDGSVRRFLDRVSAPAASGRGLRPDEERHLRLVMAALQRRFPQVGEWRVEVTPFNGRRWFSAESSAAGIRVSSDDLPAMKLEGSVTESACLAIDVTRGANNQLRYEARRFTWDEWHELERQKRIAAEQAAPRPATVRAEDPTATDEQALPVEQPVSRAGAEELRRLVEAPAVEHPYETEVASLERRASRTRAAREPGLAVLTRADARARVQAYLERTSGASGWRIGFLHPMEDGLPAWYAYRKGFAGARTGSIVTERGRAQGTIVPEGVARRLFDESPAARELAATEPGSATRELPGVGRVTVTRLPPGSTAVRTSSNRVVPRLAGPRGRLPGGRAP